MLTPLSQLFQNTKLKVADGHFTLVGVNRESLNSDGKSFEALPNSCRPFMIFDDGFEKTFLFHDEDWRNVRSNWPSVQTERDFRLVTIDRALTWDVVGFMARITRCLAEAGISVGVLSSFSRDHLLIKDADLGRALSTLNGLFGNSDGAETNGL